MFRSCGSPAEATLIASIIKRAFAEIVRCECWTNENECGALNVALFRQTLHNSAQSGSDDAFVGPTRAIDHGCRTFVSVKGYDLLDDLCQRLD